MKSKHTLFLAFFLMLAHIVFSQAPNSFKYQSMVRKADGSALTNQSVKVKISILKSSTSGDVVYSEIHSTNSNTFGIINLNIGEGSSLSGSFTSIDWSIDTYFVKVEMDENGGENYTLSSISQLLSVPYALNANSANSVDWSNVQNRPDMTIYATKEEAIQRFRVSTTGDTLHLSSANWVIIPGISIANPVPKPIINSISLVKTSTEDGVEINLTIQAESEKKVNWLNSSFEGPSGNIYGGGRGLTFTNVGTNLWEYQEHDFISKWAPSGTYYYSNISVENADDKVSDIWDKEVSFTHSSNFIATKPVVTSVTLSTEKLESETKVTFTIVATSNAPVNWINSSFYGPNGNVYGGGNGRTFTEKSSGVWELIWVDTISNTEPNGEYYYENVSVENAGYLKSDNWVGELKVIVNNNK